MVDNNIIITREEDCRGCNKCLGACPVKFANEAYTDEHGNNKIRVNSNLCIHCGKCIEACDHSARDYKDDVNEFIQALKDIRRFQSLLPLQYEPTIRSIKGYLGF